MMASDFQEAKNVDTAGSSIMPNTRTKSVDVRVVAGPTVTLLVPRRGICGAVHAVAGSTARVRLVRFSVDGRVVASDRSGSNGLWSASPRIAKGRHALAATVVDARGRTASTRRIVRVCGA
jgi:hypothetical protein